MAGLLKVIEKLLKSALFLSFALMIVAVMTQVISRTITHQPPIWTEETARVSLLFLMAFGIGAAVLTGDLVNVDLVQMILPKPVKRVCELIAAASVSAFGFLLVPASWEFMQMGEMQTSPVLEIRMDYIFVTMPIFSALLGLFGLVKFIELLANVRETEFPSHLPTNEV